MAIMSDQGQRSSSPAAIGRQKWAVRTYGAGVAMFAGAELVMAASGDGITIAAITLGAAATGALWLLISPQDRRAASLAALGLLGVLSAAAVHLAGTDFSAVSLVRPAEALTLTLVAMLLAAQARSGFRAALVIGLCLMLLLFGIIHLLQRSEIAGLIPDWIPLRSLVPVITGGVMTICGLALLHPRSRWIAAAAVAAMFTSWIPLVHLPRIARDISDAAEWSFGAMAVGLIGALMTFMLAERGEPARAIQIADGRRSGVNPIEGR